MFNTLYTASCNCFGWRANWPYDGSSICLSSLLDMMPVLRAMNTLPIVKCWTCRRPRTEAALAKGFIKSVGRPTISPDESKYSACVCLLLTVLAVL